MQIEKLHPSDFSNNSININIFFIASASLDSPHLFHIFFEKHTKNKEKQFITLPCIRDKLILVVICRL